MDSAKTKMPLPRARTIAHAVLAELAPGCQRIQVAGSIRRECPVVGDIEMVAIPIPVLDLLGDPVGSALDPILQALVTAGRLERIKGGDRYKQFLIPRAGCVLDLFLPDLDTWGCVFTIRTGSAAFSHRLVTPQSQGGLCPNNMRFSGGRLLCNGALLATPDETDVFRRLGLEWIEPRDRSK